MHTLHPFHIGHLEIDFPVLLAPLAGYSDLAFRRLCRRFGCPYCTTEMMLDRSVTIDGRQQIALIASNEQDHPIAAQLIGREPETMVAAAISLCEKGFDVVDLNFACPVNKAMKRKRGGWLMSEPKTVLAVTAAVVEACKGRRPDGGDVPVTIKVRQKYARVDDNDVYYRIADGARAAGAAAICVHGRSVEQKYRDEADWEFLASAKAQHPDWTVIGSGDVHQPQDALDLLSQTGLDAVIVARGVLGNPWFFQQARQLAAGEPMHVPDLAEQARVLRDHLAYATELYGPDKAPRIMRKFGIRYARMHPHPKALRMAFVAAMNVEQWHDVLREHYPVEEVS